MEIALPRQKDFNHLAEWMIPKIQETGLSIEMFARKTKTSRAALYRYFHDRTRPDEQVMARICRVLRVPLEEGLSQYTPRVNGRPPGSGGGTREVTTRQR